MDLLKTSPWLAALGLLAGSSELVFSAAASHRYLRTLTIGSGIEWRFRPLVLDLNRDGHADLVATARLVDDPLRIWFGDGEGNLKPIKPTWTATSYAALAAGDINHDGFPDVVTAGHFGAVQTLLNDRKGGFTEKILRRGDGYVSAQLADLDGDKRLDLVLLGFQKAGLEIYLGDGTGTWALKSTLPETRPGPTMPGRDVIVADLNRDGHPDLVAAFQRWGLYVYYGDGHGNFSGGPAAFRAPEQPPESLVVADVNKDGNPDIVVNSSPARRHEAAGPDVYLGDGRGGWQASSAGLKVLKFVSAGLAVADLDRDGNLDIVAAGISGEVGDGYGIFWFRGDGKGGWSLVKDSGLPTEGLSVPHGISVADLEHDGIPEIVVLSGGAKGEITIWKRQ
jgi:hypothetical protein